MTYLVVLGAMAAVGCTTSRGKFTRQNYEAIYKSQPAAEVLKILGKPNEYAPGDPLAKEAWIREVLGKSNEYAPVFDYWLYQHSTPFYKTVIVFQDGVVFDTLWWDDPAEPSTPPGARKGVPLKSGSKHKHPKQPPDQPASEPEGREPTGTGN